MRVLRLTVEYDGTGYLGWQAQPQGPTVQAALERALGEMTGEPVAVAGAGRTDAGVHALGQVASFHTGTAIPAEAFAKGLTRLLPHDIAVPAAEEAPGDFDARRSARGKIYRYTLWNRPCRNPLLARYAWHVAVRLDAERMAAAGARLTGEHDFSAFRTADPDERRLVRTVDRVAVTRAGDRIDIEVAARGFLRNMVRIVTGTLVEVGRGALAAEEIDRILASRSRDQAGPTAPPHGLCLLAVRY